MVFEIVSFFLVVLAVIAGALGLLFASEATLGVALIGCACLLGILARMAQAASFRQSGSK